MDRFCVTVSKSTTVDRSNTQNTYSIVKYLNVKKYLYTRSEVSINDTSGYSAACCLTPNLKVCKILLL